MGSYILIGDELRPLLVKPTHDFAFIVEPKEHSDLVNVVLYIKTKSNEFKYLVFGNRRDRDAARAMDMIGDGLARGFVNINKINMAIQ